MEFILINENKIKVMLTNEDLSDFELRADELDYSNTETKRMFWDVLSRAKHKTGFDTDGQRVLVQLYPSRKGGCEMFVTKIGNLSPNDSGCCEQDSLSAEIHDKKASFEKAPKIYKKSKINYCVFSFVSLEDMLSVCRELQRFEYSEKCSAYIGDNKFYYLVLSGIDTSGYTPFDKFSFIGEFGTLENYETVKYYLSEHGTELCANNAVEILSKC